MDKRWTGGHGFAVLPDVVTGLEEKNGQLIAHTPAASYRIVPRKGRLPRLRKIGPRKRGTEVPRG